MPADPRETFSITNCWLTDSDLTYLFQCLNLSQLKDLDLRGRGLLEFIPSPSELCWRKLQPLSRTYCGMWTPKRRPSYHQLRVFSNSGNLLSLATVEKQLGHTARCAI